MPAHDIERPLSTRIQLHERDPIRTDLAPYLAGLRPKAAAMAWATLANFRLDPTANYFYSRDKNHYADTAAQLRYFPSHYAYRAVVQAVDALERTGLVKDIRTRPSPWATDRSKLRATALLKSIIATAPAAAIEIVESELIVLKTAGRPKRLISYQDTDLTLSMRAEVSLHNQFQGSFDVGLDGAPCVMLSRPARLYHRVFIEDFERGGRWYAPWQNIGRHLRPRITIDGRPTYEFDYRCCHPRLIAASARLDLPFDDPAFDFYRIDGFDRAEVKAAISILLNAHSLKSATAALALEWRTQGRSADRAHALALCKRIQATWAALADYWCSGVGLALQRIDAAICTDVQAELRAKAIPVLSIHDGFIVPADFKDILDEFARSRMDAACHFLREHPVRTGTERAVQQDRLTLEEKRR